MEENVLSGNVNINADSLSGDIASSQTLAGEISGDSQLEGNLATAYTATGSGADGGYYIPSVDDEGTLTWDPSKPSMPEVESSNIKGPKPIKGTDYWTEKDKQEIINEIPGTDLTGYAKKSWVEEKGYLTEHQSLDGLATEQYVTKAISQIPTPDVSGQISTHNVATDAHNDIRLLISGLTQRINALADSDDSTLDQMSEVVAYIKDNRELIEQVTTAKISVTDIIDNLTTNVPNKPLSAAQGVVLKQLVDGLTTAMGGKLDASALTEAINTALAQAKASGEFDGYTPQKGTDYWTETDKQEIVADVISALPVYSGESEAVE